MRGIFRSYRRRKGPPLTPHYSMLTDEIEHYASQILPKVSNTQLYEFASAVNADPGGSEARLCEWALSLRKHILVRYAWSIRNFQNLPFIVAVNPKMNDILHVYLNAFSALNEFKVINDRQTLIRFAELIAENVIGSPSVLDILSHAIREASVNDAVDSVNFRQTDRFIDAFLRGRAARRTLSEHFTSLVSVYANNEPQAGGSYGCFTTFDVIELVRDAHRRVSTICEGLYAIAPKLELVATAAPPAYSENGPLRDHPPEWHVEHVSPGGSLPRVPLVSSLSACDYAFRELLKNACQATLDAQLLREEASTTEGAQGRASRGFIQEVPPPVRVRVRVGEQVDIMIEDSGIGLSRETLDRAWSFGFTTARTRQSTPADANGPRGGAWNNDGDIGHRHSELAGYGFGLPMARLYARHLGGDVKLQTLTMVGTHTRIMLADMRGRRQTVYMSDGALQEDYGTDQSPSQLSAT